MELGNFSVSLAVKDIEASRLFYEKLGFTVFMGDPAQHWLLATDMTLTAVAGSLLDAFLPEAKEEEAYKKAARELLALTDMQIKQLIEKQALTEVIHDG